MRGRAAYAVLAAKFLVKAVGQGVDETEQRSGEHLPQIEEENVVVAGPIVDAIDCGQNVQQNEDDWVR